MLQDDHEGHVVQIPSITISLLKNAVLPVRGQYLSRTKDTTGTTGESKNFFLTRA
jgi:hypothetical protein